MCGIVGYVGKEKCIPRIISGLESLEYRGYDSAGIAYVKSNTEIKKEKGRIANLKEIINMDEDAYLGIGHTRWATHGEPNQVNSHPHRKGVITLVHNGILENYEELKSELSEYEFVSETDSEVMAALIDKLYKEYNDMLIVLNKLKEKAIGSYALGIIVDNDNKLYAIRKDSPLIIGVSGDGNYIASDVPAILKYTNKYYLLLNDEYAVISEREVHIYNDGNEVKKDLNIFDFDIEASTKDGYDHFMIKEIYEQPKVLKNTVNEYVKDIDTFLSKMDGLEKYTNIDIVGCGSAYHVGKVGASLIKKYSKVNVITDIASEYRYEEHNYSDKHLLIIISQSGETADSLAVLRHANEQNVDTLAIVNVVGSSIAREAKKVMYIKAGPEISVATTKAYTCQLIILSLIACYLGIKNNILDKNIIDVYKNVEELLNEELSEVEDIKDIAKTIYKHNDIYFLGRKVDYAYAMEASLKLKEVSYLHSESYQAGELKHGTISLIEKDTPVVSIVSDESIKLKTLSNIKECVSRGANSIIITNDIVEDKTLYKNIIKVKKVNDLIDGVFIIAKCQLLAYYVALLNECEIDKPRNLAKSVTVE